MPDSSNNSTKLLELWGERIEIALNASREGIFEWDIQAGKIVYSRMCFELMGRLELANPMSLLRNTPCKVNIFTDTVDCIHPDDRSSFDAEVKRIIEGYTESSVKIEVRLLHPNGAWRWCRINATIKYTRSYQAARMIGTIGDISRRKTIESLANEERQSFRSLIEHISDNIFFKNRESRFVQANSATARKLGVLTPSDLVGKTDADFFDHDMAELSRNEELEIMRSGTPMVSKLREETWPDKSKSFCITTKAPWYSSDGKIKGIMGFTNDVTPLVKAQNALRHTALELERRNKVLEEEINLAREVQLALLPEKIPSMQFNIEGQLRRLDFARQYLPGSGVAGDWYQVFPVGSVGAGLLLCDVMGHGVRSALIASMIRGLIEEMDAETTTPAAFLARLNNTLTKILAKTGVNVFASAFYIYLDMEEGCIRYASAGHPGAMVIRSDGSVTELKPPRGMALGLMEGIRYSDVEIELEADMRFMLYTDGLSEAVNSSGEEFGVERIKHVLERANPQNPGEIGEILIDAARRFSESDKNQFADDVCILSARYSCFSDSNEEQSQD